MGAAVSNVRTYCMDYDHVDPMAEPGLCLKHGLIRSLPDCLNSVINPESQGIFISMDYK